MPNFNVPCPGCSRVLVVPEQAIGRQGQCPACAAVFVLTVPATPADTTTFPPKLEQTAAAMIRPERPAPAGLEELGPAPDAAFPDAPKPAAGIEFPAGTPADSPEAYAPGSPAEDGLGTHSKPDAGIEFLPPDPTTDWSRPFGGYRPPAPPSAGAAVAELPAWITVRRGLSTAAVGVAILGISLALVSLGSLALWLGALVGFRPMGGMGGAEFGLMYGAMCIIYLGLPGGFITAFVGQCMCCKAPTGQGVRAPAVWSMLLTGGSVLGTVAVYVLFMILIVMSVGRGFGGGFRQSEFIVVALYAMAFIVPAMIAAGITLFAVFLGRTARMLGDEPLTSRAGRLAIFVVAAAVVVMGLTALLMLGANFLRSDIGLIVVVSIALYAVSLLALLITHIWLFRLIRAVRDGLAKVQGVAYRVGADPLSPPV